MAAFAIAAMAIATAVVAGGYHVEYTFEGGSDGAEPNAAFLALGGKFYGTAPVGGANGFGVVYSFDPATGGETALYAFKGGGDGAHPYGALINVGGMLYGTTIGGGANGVGTVFAFNPNTNTESPVYSFKGGSDGEDPYSSLIEVGGTFYGTTTRGGANGVGTVFSLNPTSGAETVVHAFEGGDDGADPSSNLIKVNGSLYGTTTGGGIPNCGAQGSCGTLFSVDLTTGVETVAYAFKGGGDGAYPMAGLVKLRGKLYGATDEGGDLCDTFGYGCGTVFSFDPATGAETVLYTFKGGAAGDHPFDGLISVDGTLYGTTFTGTSVNGKPKLGTVFSLNPVSQVEKVLHLFAGGADGSGPTASLLYWGRKLYGTTSGGGTSSSCGGGCGTLFSIRP